MLLARTWSSCTATARPDRDGQHRAAAQVASTQSGFWRCFAHSCIRIQNHNPRSSAATAAFSTQLSMAAATSITGLQTARNGRQTLPARASGFSFPLLA